MIVIALTGSIATGKSEAARVFASAGIPTFDSDDIVHELYSVDGAAVDAIRKLIPQVASGGYIDRQELSVAVQRDQLLLSKIEAIVHPLVRLEQARFLTAVAASNAPFAILDIPLLFETSRQEEVDRIVLVTCSAEIQRKRALARPGMTEEKLRYILSRQIPDSDKRAIADFVVDTSSTLAETREQIEAIIHHLQNELKGESDA